MSLSVVSWKWKPMPGYRSEFGPDTVNVLRRMVARNYPHPHQFYCVTDDPVGLDPDVHVVPLWKEWGDIPSPHGRKNPSCYRRLKAFSAEAAQLFGPRFVSLDLDCVICGDMSPLWNRPEDFVIWGNTNRTTPYNGGMFLLTSGSRTQVWEKFDPQTSPRATLHARLYGSDQAFIAYVLGPNEKRWSRSDGVYSFRNDLKHTRTLPPDAKVVFFHGADDPWQPRVQHLHPWVKEHWL